MKKLIISIIACFIAIAVQANTIKQDGVYVTVSPETYASSMNGYGSYFTAKFSLSSKTEVTVHVQITNDKTGNVVKDTWVTLKPDSRNEAAATFLQLSGIGTFTVRLIQH